MKITKAALKISIISLGLFLVSGTLVQAETIKDFNSEITVVTDSTVIVKEKITYDFEGAVRHGIFRTINLESATKEPLEIDGIAVIDTAGQSYLFETSKSNNQLTIKIGDPNQTITGIKEYNITYIVHGSISYYKDYDEIYWNVTGNNWPVVIEKAEATIVLPSNTNVSQQACYYGPVGSTMSCVSNGSLFTVPAPLQPGEGLTVAVGFSKGVVALYQSKIESSFMQFVKTYWPVLIPVVVFIFMFWKWRKKGRDPKGRGTIIAEYNVPDKLTPLEVGGIINDNFKNKNISAEIIHLATKGYLKINQIEKKILGFIPQKDYNLTLLKDPADLERLFDQEILRALFGINLKAGDTTLISDMKNQFYLSIPAIDLSIRNTLLQQDYYTNLPDPSRRIKPFFLIFSLFVYAISLLGGINFIHSMFDRLFTGVLFSSLIFSGIIWAIFIRLMPARSRKGVATYEYLLGLKQYLQIAEKDRLDFHNAPDKKPEIFEALLPYAVVFGVEKAWAKEFEGIYVNPPEWYSGKGGTFGAVYLAHEMALFSSFSNASLSSSPSSSGGSGGGGSSGGGGGGGGGGSW